LWSKLLTFSTTFFRNISHSLRNWARCDQVCMSVCMWSTGYSCQISIKLEFTWRIFEKCTKTKFDGNPSSGRRLVPCGHTDGWTARQTDRHDEAESRLSQFCERLLETYLISNWITGFSRNILIQKMFPTWARLFFRLQPKN
jgi:hypothetical protein